MRVQEIGNAQVWYYSGDRTIILWGCFFEAPFRDATHPDTPDMQMLWQRIEQWLHLHFPEATRIFTPFSDPLFDTTEYQAFLRSRGYRKVRNQPSYGKVL